MTCRSCGGAIAEGSRFCVHCGSEQGVAAPTTPVDTRLGLTLDNKYRIDARIGAGGMATVYRATRLLIGDAVAVKILHPDQVRDPQATERFRREAQAAARLKHPNAVAIYDFGVSETGLVYLVMELVEGQSLRHLIKDQGPLLPSAAAEILTQVCGALDEAHRQNIVHRDLKPDNIVVQTSPRGLRVKVLDFGIARLRDLTSLGNLTQTGSVMGTPHYMSPEQCLGEELDARSDVYSLGIVLYEMLVGIVPFNAPTSMAVVVQHVNGTPAPVRVLNASLSPAVETAAMRALSKRREDRPQTAGAFADHFATAVKGVVPSIATSPVAVGPGYPPTPNLLPTVQMSTPWKTSVPTPGTQGATAQARTGPVLKRGVALAVGSASVVLVVGVGWWVFSREPAGATDPPVTPTVPPAIVSDAQPNSPPVPPPPTGSDATPSSSEGAQQPAPRPGVNASVTTPVPAPPPPSAPPTVPIPAPIVEGSLTVRASPGTLIQIDSKEVGVTDASGLIALPNIQPGRHVVTGRKTGYRDGNRTADVMAGRSDVVDLVMVPLNATLSATANVPDATIQIGALLPQRLPLTNHEVGPGTHQVKVTKNGYRSFEETVEFPPGEAVTRQFSLEPLPIEELLRAAETYYRSGNFSRAATEARAVTTNNPQAGRAFLLLGQSLYRLKNYAESLGHLGRAIDLGETVELAAKHRHGFMSQVATNAWCDGIVTLSKSGFSFRSSSEPRHQWPAAPSKIVSVTQVPALLELNVDIMIPDGRSGREKKEDLDFVHPDYVMVTVTGPRDPNSILQPRTTVRDCKNCDDGPLNVLAGLLRKLSGR